MQPGKLIGCGTLVLQTNLLLIVTILENGVSFFVSENLGCRV